MLSPRSARLAILATTALWFASVATPGRAATAPQLTPKQIAHWTAIGSCETGFGGPAKWDWGTKHRPGEGTKYQGGLGISALMWQEWAGELGLLDKYPAAFDAPALVQMEVAQYGVSEHHAVWGCKA